MRYRTLLETRGVRIRRPVTGGEPANFLLLVNESLTRRTAPELATAFIDALTA